MLNSENSQ